MANVRYVVTLTGDEREDLLAVADRGRAPATQTRHANVLLAVDRGEHAGPGMTDAQAAAAYHSTTQTVRTARRRLVGEGLGRAICRRRREGPSRARAGGEAGAKIVAPARADPPEGHAGRAPRPVEEKSAGLGHVGPAGHVAIGNLPRKTSFAHGWPGSGASPSAGRGSWRPWGTCPPPAGAPTTRPARSPASTSPPASSSASSVRG